MNDIGGIIKRLFTTHWQVKLMALTLAVGVWFYGNTRIRDDVVLRVPLNVQLPDGYELLYKSHSQAQVRFTGPQYLIQRQQEEARQNYIQFNLRPAEEDVDVGEMALEIDPARLNIPGSELAMMNVVVVSPLEASLVVDRIASRTLPVEASLSGRPRGGYKISDYTVTPSEVSVEGPSLALDRLESLKTISIPVWDAQESLRRYVPLAADHVLTWSEDISIPVSFRTSPSQVAVHVSVGIEYRQSGIEGVPVKLLAPVGFPYSAEISEDALVEVVVSGLPDVVEDITAEDISAYVDLSGLEDEEIASGATAPYKETVYVILRSGIDAEVTEVNPEQVTILLSN